MSDDQGDDMVLELEGIARALAEWSSDRPWYARHPKNRAHWLYVAEAITSNDPAIVEPVMAHVRARKGGEGPAGDPPEQVIADALSFGSTDSWEAAQQVLERLREEGFALVRG